MERYTKIKPIGSGTFGQAWLVQSTVSQRKYALKELGVAAMTEQDRYLALNEAKILSKLKHKNIVRYKEAFVDQGKLCIAMEFAEKGDLYTRIRDRNGAHFPETQILEWFTQLCLALKYIHGQNILHRDLKTQNIFLGKDDVIKLGDFGIARMLNSTLDHAQTTVGTPYYLSPEICQRKPYNHKSDMWSLGCVLYEMTTLKHAFNANNFSALVIKILQGQYHPIPGFYGPLLEDLVSVLLKKNPDERPSAKQLLYVPAMQPYVKRFLLSERDRTDSVASDVSDISSATSGPDCSQMSSSTGTDKPKEVTIVADKSISSKQSDQVERNMFVGAARVRKRRLSSNTASTAGGNVCASENRVKEPENLLVNESRSKARENVFVTDNALNRWENVCASSNVSKAQEYFVTSDYAPKPASVNLQKARENLPSRCSVSTRKQGLLALAHAQQRRHSEQNSASCQPGSRIQKARIHSQGAPSREMAETEDDVFAKNQATITPAGSTNQRKVTNSRLNQHVTNVASSRNNKFISLADQRRQKPALSVCEPNCGEEVHTKKLQKSAATVLDRNCWPSEQRNRRVTSRPENNSTDKENRGSLSGHAQVTVKRRVSSTASSSALKPIQASNVEKQQTVKTGPRASGFEHENRKRTYTVSHERRLSEFEIPEVDELRHCSGESKNSKGGNRSCKDTNCGEAVCISQKEACMLASEKARVKNPCNPQNGKQIHSSEQKCENAVQQKCENISKTTGSKTVDKNNTDTSCCKFTFCGKTLQLENVSSHDSVYAHMEALRMHLEKELGTRLLTAVYRYITNVSLEEHERVTQTVMCMLGEDKMTYFPVLLQLVACEAIYFH